MRKKRAAILSDSEGEDDSNRKARPKITDTDNEGDDDGEKNENEVNNEAIQPGVVDGESSDEGVREGGDNDNAG